MALEYGVCLCDYFLGELSRDLLELLKGCEELEIVEGCVFDGWREKPELHVTGDDPGDDPEDALVLLG